MRIALLADLHANREAVTACLDHAAGQRADRLVFLGDLVGYGADPAWTVETVREFCDRAGAVAVLGNHDQAALEGPGDGMHPDASLAARWTRGQLAPDHRAFLAALPLSVIEEDRLYVHANAWAPARWAYVRGTMAAAKCLHATEARLVFCGHVHQPAFYHLTSHGRAVHFQPVNGAAIPVAGHRQWLSLPGSVGQPRDGNPAACYALLDTGRRTLTYFRVAYDWAAAADKVVAAGLPEKLANRLRYGA